MTVSELADRLALDQRQLRYVIDLDLLPGSMPAGQGRGTPREFFGIDALTIACLALMRKAGMRQSVLRSAVPLLHRQFNTVSSDNEEGQAKAPIMLHVGDDDDVHLSCANIPAPMNERCKGSLSPLVGRNSQEIGLGPVVFTHVDLDTLRQRVGA
jgi:hypothetical protein